MVAGFVGMAVYLLALGGGATYAILDGRAKSADIAALVEANRRNAEIAEAQGCVNSHARIGQIRAAIGIVPDAIVEVANDADPAEIDAFLAAIQTRVDATIVTPGCDLPAAEATLERLGADR